MERKNPAGNTSNPAYFMVFPFPCLSGRVTNTWLKVDPPFGSISWFRRKEIRNAGWFGAREQPAATPL
jgi:hypothetical protein